MSSILLDNYSVRFNQHFSLKQINWRLDPEQHWVILGGNGAGKSALAAILCGVGEPISGAIHGLVAKTALVSFEAQAELIAQERKKDAADILDVIPEGTPVKDLLNSPEADPKRLVELIELFKFEALLERGFRKLSTGETRKLMLIRALACRPDLLVLDEPFEGLDAASTTLVAGLLLELARQTRIVMVLNRVDEIPSFITHLAYMEHGQILHCVAMSDPVASADLQQLLHLKTTDLTIPQAPREHLPPKLDPSQPLVRLRKARIAYDEKQVLTDLDWTIQAGEHWQVTGPNGSGKTCLLNLITGDHPQCYTNDIFVFGMQRGSGESIWQIKRYIGYVSSGLQWEYRVSITVRNVIISGFYDSIGLYQKYTERERIIAEQWLAVLGMSARATESFSQLSYGDQRLVLIARAMVKHPSLLILDEPCLGLDDLNRQLVLALIEKICAGTETTVLYVNHRAKDQIAGIQQHLALG
ncbi:molybdate ABC transporter ATP-binding protein ModF [Thiothrix eikelboomii]|uniref:molybdate ABC transporter ATP-binding protein ModF n=1 Tax=Thiothrix eikelboomii TaxID=92487 RepID=UPI003BB07FE4